MKPYCESVAQYVIPTLRAIIAKRLMEKYSMTQQAAAGKLGLTQSAVSQYMRSLRGSKIRGIEKDEVVSKEIDGFVDMVASGNADSMKAMESFCNICRTIRKRRLLCEMHIKSFPEIKDCKSCV